MEDASELLKIPKSECPDNWIRQPRHKWPKSWSNIEDPVVPLERNLYGHPLAGLLWERQFEKVLLKHGWEKIPNWECLFVHREKGLFLSVYVDDIKLAGKKQNLDPMWKVLNKEVDLGEPTSFLDHVYLGCTQRQCEISKDIVDNYRTMFESRISAGRSEKLPFPQNLRISSWSYDMAGHAKKCVERYCELANKTIQGHHEKTCAKSWSPSWIQPCLARFKTLARWNWAQTNPTLADKDMHASWKPTNLRESAKGKNSTKRSWGSHCWEGVQFVESLQSCAQVCPPYPKQSKSLMRKSL